MLNPDQAAFASKHLPRRGARWVAQRLGLPHKSLWRWATNRGIRFAQSDHTLTITEVAARAGISHTGVLYAARQARVLMQVGPRPRGQGTRRIVPTKWGEAFITERQAIAAAAELIDVGWLDLNRAAATLGLHRTTLHKALTGGGGRYATQLQAIERRTARDPNTGRAKTILDPRGVDALRRQLDNERARARAMVTVKSIAVDLGIRLNTADSLAHRHCSPQLLLVGRQPLLHITPVEADLLRVLLTERRAAA